MRVTNVRPIYTFSSLHRHFSRERKGKREKAYILKGSVVSLTNRALLRKLEWLPSHNKHPTAAHGHTTYLS